jgi:Fe-S-cluster-containing hydrogenase component 2
MVAHPVRLLLEVLLVLRGVAGVITPLRDIRHLVSARPTDPVSSLRAGSWFKLICGAANQDIVAIRNLATVFALAGADCIDMSADPAVVRAAKSGIEGASLVAASLGLPAPQPWLMVSVQDGADDLHFRKAAIDARGCPADCDRPCERVCPAEAFHFDGGTLSIIDERCYGCGRCLPVCPYDRLSAVQQPASLDAIRALMPLVDAIEIHTRPGHLAEFEMLWGEIGDTVAAHATMVAVSTPQLGASMSASMAAMETTLARARSADNLLRMWQLDGRPMSGDVGAGATVPAVELAVQVARARALPFGDGRFYMSLAGGTNDCTVDVMRSRGLRADGADAIVHGIAYGSYARKQVGRVLARLPDGQWAIEACPELLAEALVAAQAIMAPLKAPCRAG